MNISSILKEAPADLGDLKQSARRRLNPRLPHYPSLDYLCLYETLDSLIEIVPSVQYGQSGKQDFLYFPHILQTSKQQELPNCVLCCFSKAVFPSRFGSPDF